MQNGIFVGKYHKPKFFLKNPLTFSAECSRINKSVEDSGSQKTSGSPTISGEWEHSSAGRASALQAEGHRFEPCRSHILIKYGGIAQLARAHGSYPWCRWFKSSSRYLYGILAQLGEHLPYKQRVIGSSPIVPTTWPGSSVG